ncbi:MAG: DNA polymerase III subunit epsilon [Alphaproteobacteria bacterium]|nr:DNA polymerase III subunit epsilon [Alphaproteobacteria bacterium]MCB9927946.1 DNA polymerase III subunit epsilon [Alphaproteobacteria bacterium]
MREIVLDTETTGLDPLQGDRVVEIAALELRNHVPTGAFYHCYLNPERDMPQEAFAVHGLSEQFLADKPLFRAEVKLFLDFIADAPLVIHNGAFDLKFLNAELARLKRPGLSQDRLIDTLLMARKRFPGAPASLDALCRRFNVDLSVRTLHGALVDCQLLAEVYLELVGGRQPGFALAAEPRPAARSESVDGDAMRLAGPVETVAARPPRPHAPTAAEAEAHRAFVADGLKNALWLRGEAEKTA